MLSQNLGVAVKFGSGAKTRTRADFAGEFKERLENMRHIFVNLVEQKRKLRLNGNAFTFFDPNQHCKIFDNQDFETDDPEKVSRIKLDHPELLQHNKQPDHHVSR